MTQTVTKWETYGFRINFQRHGEDYQKWKDDDLHEWIENAYHAISIDDERETFHPVMWQEFDSEGRHKTEFKTPTGQERKIEQVWFSGVHSNVGGGYPKDQLAHVSLKWMMTHASQAGLKFDDDVRKLYEMESDEFGKLYDSRSSLGSFYRYKPRSIENLSREVGIDPSGKTSKPKEEMRRLPLIHASAIRRIAHTTRGYSLPGLPSAGEYAQVDFVTDPESGERMNKRWHQKDLVPLSEKGAEAAPDCFVAEYESFGPDNKTNIRSYTRQLTASLVSFRRGFFYALYLWVFTFLGAIFWSQSRGISQGHWKDAHGDEKTWLLPSLGTIVILAIAAFFKIRHRPVQNKEVMISNRYLFSRWIVHLSMLVTLVILFKGPIIAGLTMIAPSFASEGISALGGSVILLAFLVIALFLILRGNASTKHRIRELNVSAWHNAMGIKASQFRDSLWIRLAAKTQSPACRSIAANLEHPVVPAIALLIIVIPVCLVLLSAFQAGSITSNVVKARSPAGKVGKDLASLTITKDEKLRTFTTDKILASGIRVEKGLVYTVKITSTETPWKDASYDAGPEGILKKPSSMMSIFGSQKRLPSAQYFHLLGSIGKASSKPFLVKDGIPFTAHETGELFLFVNDVPGFYGNNTGKSELRIMLVGGGR